MIKIAIVFLGLISSYFSYFYTSSSPPNYYGFIPYHIATFTNTTINYYQHKTKIGVRFLENSYVLNITSESTNLFLFSSLHKNNIKYVTSDSLHQYSINYQEGEKEIIETNGLHVFKFNYTNQELFNNVLNTIKLFKSENISYYNTLFIKQKMDYQFQKIENRLINIEEDELRSGDILLITRLDGLDPLIMWGTGSFAGHTAIILEIDGEKYVCESTDNNPFGKSYWPPPYGIIKTPYQKWIKIAYKANFMVSIISLDDTNQKSFNNNEAIEAFQSLQGLPYGYHNLLLGWIDTARNNFPEYLSPEFLSVALATLEKYKPDITTRVMGEAINKRLNTRNLTISESILLANRKDISFGELISIPEKDNWIYSDGKSRVCDSLVVSILKGAGVFGNITTDIFATEFTPKDLYQLAIYQQKHTFPKCLNNNPQFCQIMGNYLMYFPKINTIEPYQNMNQKCGSMAPGYSRKKTC